jgi:hypothetical protein
MDLLLIDYVRKTIKKKFLLELICHLNIPDLMVIEIENMLLELTYFNLKSKKDFFDKFIFYNKFTISPTENNYRILIILCI